MKNPNRFFRVPSYAKVNLNLKLMGLRPDHYMELRTILQTVSLRDFLYFRKTEGPLSVSSDSSQAPSGPKNLIYRAAAALKKETGTALGAEIRLKKRIPVAAGLGGGSSNAAVTLMTLNRLWGASLDPQTIRRLGISIGMDVPAFLLGGTVLGVGRGEEVYPLEEITGYHILLVNPNIEISTLDIYNKAKKILTLNRDSIRMTQPLYTIESNKEIIDNDLERCVINDFPVIKKIKDGLEALGASACALTGSGATVFGLFPNPSLLLKAFKSLNKTGWRCIPARLIGRDEYHQAIQFPKRVDLN